MINAECQQPSRVIGSSLRQLHHRGQAPVEVECRSRPSNRTGVRMEALTPVSIRGATSNRHVQVGDRHDHRRRPAVGEDRPMVVGGRSRRVARKRLDEEVTFDL